MIIHDESGLTYCEFIRETGFDPAQTPWWTSRATERRAAILELYHSINGGGAVGHVALLQAVMQHDSSVSVWTTNEGQLRELGFSVLKTDALRDEDLAASFNDYVEYLYAVGINVSVEREGKPLLMFGRKNGDGETICSSKKSTGGGLINQYGPIQYVPSHHFIDFTMPIRRFIVRTIEQAVKTDSIPDQVSCKLFETPDENFIGPEANEIGRYEEYLIVDIARHEAMGEANQEAHN